MRNSGKIINTILKHFYFIFQARAISVVPQIIRDHNRPMPIAMGPPPGAMGPGGQPVMSMGHPPVSMGQPAVSMGQPVVSMGQNFGPHTTIYHQNVPSQQQFHQQIQVQMQGK